MEKCVASPSLVRSIFAVIQQGRLDSEAPTATEPLRVTQPRSSSVWPPVSTSETDDAAELIERAEERSMWPDWAVVGVRVRVGTRLTTRIWAGQAHSPTGKLQVRLKIRLKAASQG
eukprot:6172675-Pleurochrysis_carterae.AAC.2